MENSQQMDWDPSIFPRGRIESLSRTLEDTESDVASSVASSEDPREVWYRDIGYLPPLDEFTVQLLEQINSDLSVGRINPTDIEKFQEGLEDRNVALDPSTDPYLLSLKGLTSTAAQETQEEKARCDHAWKLDLEKSIHDPDEPVFRHTIMMSMIDRHRLIYSGGDDNQRVIDFAVERPWTCPPMPTRVSKDLQSDGKFLTQPKPDLAIAFCRNHLFPKHWQSLPQATRDIVCYEGRGKTKTARAFHFMTVEGKQPYKTVDDNIALSQCLNNASQSLHNMYEFFKEAGEEHLDIFFDRVRFFSAVSTTRGVKIRIHRACRVGGHRDGITAPDAAGQANPSPGMDPIFMDYPLQFEYDDYFRADNTEFTRDNVVRTFEHILVGYGIQVLSKCLRDAADAVTEKCHNYFEEHNQRVPLPDGCYSHGQGPPPTRSRASLASQQSRESTIAFEQSNTTPKRRRYN
ncbi:hypothetical protein NUW58_g6493 [Xylaria curta]|uniref:Uncharacterized protein n=1 Tax=Xylaria curta TaxID=42375 RepID=A0ACC1NSD9_9PEZI|nr:hypothetical protein NUW58_g6493 [Xylaria curta]